VNGKPFASRWQAATEALGLALSGTILFSSHVLLTEGDSDPVYLFAMLQRLASENGWDVDLNRLGIISGRSSRDTAAILRVLCEGSAGPRIVVLFDGDKGGADRHKALSSVLKKYGCGHVFLDEGLTIEDYLPAAAESYVRFVASAACEVADIQASQEALERIETDALATATTDDGKLAGLRAATVEAVQVNLEVSADVSALSVAARYRDALLDFETAIPDGPQRNRTEEFLLRVTKALHLPSRSAGFEILAG
jgi:hypothetical protein